MYHAKRARIKMKKEQHSVNLVQQVLLEVVQVLKMLQTVQNALLELFRQLKERFQQLSAKNAAEVPIPILRDCLRVAYHVPLDHIQINSVLHLAWLAQLVLFVLLDHSFPRRSLQALFNTKIHFLILIAIL